MMKKIILLIFVIFTNQSFAEEPTYNWKGTQKSKISKLTFKTNSPENNEEHIKKIIEEENSITFCATEKEVLNKAVASLDEDCAVSSKEIGKITAKITATCEDQELNLNLIKKNNNLITGTNIGKSNNEEFNIIVKSNVLIKKHGLCEEIK